MSAKLEKIDHELTKWNQDAARVLLRLGLELQEKNRMSGDRISRFIRFNVDLSRYKRGKAPILKLKPLSENKKGKISLEVLKAAGDEVLLSQARDEEFEVKTTNKETAVISDSSPSLELLTVKKAVSDQIPAFESGAECAKRLIKWWEGRSSK